MSTFALSPRPATLKGLFSQPKMHLFTLFLFSVVMMFSKLGGHGLANYDDCFYAQKAKEILATGEWMTMHYNGRPAWENPPFFMWLIALSYRIFGVSEFAAKLPSALFGVGTILLVYWLAKQLFDSWTAFLSSSVLATTILFTRYARRAMMDVTLSFFVTLALLAVVLALRRDLRWMLLWGICTGISILIKSVLGLFPLFIGVVFLLVRGRWRLLFHPWSIIAFVLMFAVGGAWYLDQVLKFGEQFLGIHFGWLIIYRAFTLEQQAWYDHLSYVRDLLTYYWPWMPFLCVGLWTFGKRIHERDEALLLILWVSSYLVIMSIMLSRVVWYIVPMLPASSMIVGATLNRLLGEREKVYSAMALAVLTLVSAAVLNLTPIQVEAEREPGIRVIAPVVKYFGRQGAKVIAYRQDYYGLNNSLQFYSDYAGYPIYDRVDSIARQFQSRELVLCVLNSSELPGLTKNIQQLYVLKQADETTLLANQPVRMPEEQP